MFKKEKVKDLHYIVSGIVSASELQDIADTILLKYGEDAKISGFRKGHVPISVLRQKYNKVALGDAMDKAMNQDLSNFINEKKLKLAAAPKASITKWSIGEDLEYSLEFDILPMLPSFDLGKFTITKKTTTVSNDEIAKTLENIRQNRSLSEKQEDSYKAKKDDKVVIDFKGFIDDVPFEGGEATKHHLTLGSNSFIEGFEEQLIGCKAGDKLDVNVIFPKNYHSENLANKKAKFEVFVHEVRIKKLPELNDDLAKEIGYDNLDKLKDHIKDILEKQYLESSKQLMREELLEVLNDKVKLSLPESLVEQEYKMAEDEFNNHSCCGKSDCDCHSHDSNHKCDKFDSKKQRQEAERRVKLGLLLAEWGALNKIEISKEELQSALFEEASKYPDQKKVFEYYHKNNQALSMLRGILFERKVLDEMLSKVKIKEKTVNSEELFKQPK